MDASCFYCQFSLNTAGIIIGVYEIVQYTLLFFFALHFFKDDSDFLTIVTCCLCALIIVSALLVYGSFKNIRRYVVSWIFVVALIVVIQLMVLFDVIHVVNTKSSEASDKSFLYTALEVFCLVLNISFLIIMMEFQRKLKEQEDDDRLP
ncbi:uncharacterized protein [Chironomus tepperi]|uniref:Uncharacterized protein n=1 Tax=Chironomus riparius TaxID=315576 RepID=A0A9N9RYG6_9DIPT|nr:unnamed protein product [Chironomus riparius]